MTLSPSSVNFTPSGDSESGPRLDLGRQSSQRSTSSGSSWNRILLDKTFVSSEVIADWVAETLEMLCALKIICT